MKIHYYFKAVLFFLVIQLVLINTSFAVITQFTSNAVNDFTINGKTIHKLIKSAKTGMQNAKTPNNLKNDSRFGAAVLTTKGHIYSAGQYFSDTYTLTTHAEQNALIHAAAHGEYEIIAIAIISNKSGKDPTNPCNICKQLLYESYLRSKYNIKIFLLNSNGKIVKTLHLLDMISYPWPVKVKTTSKDYKSP